MKLKLFILMALSVFIFPSCSSSIPQKEGEILSTSDVNMQEQPETFVVDKDMKISFSFGERTGVYTGTVNVLGLPDGFGKFVNNSDSGNDWTYYGEWENGHFNGNGITQWTDYSHMGLYKVDYMDGVGMYHFNDGELFCGEFEKGEPSLSYIPLEGSIINKEDANEPVTPSVSSGAFIEEDILSNLDVKEYSYTTKRNYVLLLVITNNSDKNISISSDLIAKDNNNKLIGAKSTSENAFEQGSTICLSFFLDEIPSKYEYNFTVKEEKRFSCVLSDLSYETSIAKDKAIISVTNTGIFPAEFVEFHCLFFLDGRLVGFNTGYLTDDDNEIKAGKTEYREAKFYDNFDSVQVYLTGRR